MSFPVQPRSLAEIGASRRPICALTECNEPVSRNKAHRWNRTCCIEHARIVATRAARNANQRVDIEQLRLLAGLGWYAVQICQIYDVHPDSVWACARRHGIELQHHPRYREICLHQNRWAGKDHEIIELYESGVPLREIARQTGETTGAVAGRLHRLEMMGRRKPRKEAPRLPQIEFPPVGHCMYPVDEGYCGQPVENPAKPYCDSCRRIAYRKAAPIDMREAA